MRPDRLTLHLHCKETTMDTMKGIDALHRAEAVSKTGGDFTLAFYPFNRKAASRPETTALETHEHCTMRLPMPQEKWEVDGKNYFLFAEADGSPRACHRSLIRFMSFSDDGYRLNKITWYNHET